MLDSDDDESEEYAREAVVFDSMTVAINELAAPEHDRLAPPQYPPGVFPIADAADILRSAPPFGSIRALPAVINHRIEAYPILDPGAQIVAMSEAVATHANIGWDPNTTIQLQSANGTINQSLGLARNVPFTFDDTTVFLQCHITKNPAYDVLLGRPFNILCETVVADLEGEQQNVTIVDPNERMKRRTLPTIPRRKIQFRMTDPSAGPASASEEKPMSEVLFRKHLRFLKGS